MRLRARTRRGRCRVIQARSWAQDTGVAVVVKTGHLSGEEAANTWVAPDGTTVRIPSRKVHTTNTHGTGCSLSSALATRLGGGEDPAQALAWTTSWLHVSILHGGGLHVGRGHGPVDHAHRARRLAAAADPSPWLPGQRSSALTLPEKVAPSGGSLRAAVEPVGPWTEALWRAGAPTARQIAEGDFVTALVEGSLQEEAFAFYLSQDSLYLVQYGRALADLGARAPRISETTFWGEAASRCDVVEGELHRRLLGDAPRPEVGPVTSAYADFLKSTVLVSCVVSSFQ